MFLMNYNMRKHVIDDIKHETEELINHENNGISENEVVDGEMSVSNDNENINKD